MDKAEIRRQPARTGADAPTLEDVAARAGVSTATVSRCLNDPAKVSEATRVRVLEAPDRVAIGFDNRKAMQAMADRVLDFGHRSLAFVTASRRDNDRARQRGQGVEDAMRLRGLDPGTLRVVETSYSISNGARALEAVLQSVPRPTAVLCGNDVLAVGALKQALRMGLRVPGDLSITGFDDIEIAQIVTPELTTVHVPHWQMGRGAARLLVTMCNGDGAEANVALQTRLTLRASLGPVPGV